MKSIKIIAAILALLTVFGCFASCKKDEEQSENSNDVTTAESKTSFLEGVRFDGKEVTVHVRGDEEAINEVLTEDYGDSLSSALYQRTQTTCDRLGVEIKLHVGKGWANHAYDESVNEIRRSIMTQDGAFDIVSGWSARAPMLAAEGLMTDLNQVEYFNARDEWWSQSIVDALTINQRLYMVTGDISATYMDSCYAVIVNQTVAADNDLDYESFYDVVYNKQWTLEYLNGVVKDCHSDNGNGVDDEDDVYGLIVGGYGVGDCMWSSTGMNIIKNNGIDRPVLEFDLERAQNVMDKLYALFIENPGTTVCEPQATAPVKNSIDHFRKDGAMFTIDVLGNLKQFADMKSIYGVLPTPMLDENQEDYYTNVQQSMSLWSIPIDAELPEMSSAVMTSLAHDSTEQVIEIHYEKLLKTRYIKDSVSGYMIDIIYNNVYMNFDTIYNEAMGEDFNKKNTMPAFVFRCLMGETPPSKNISSWWQEQGSSIETRFEAIMDKFYEEK